MTEYDPAQIWLDRTRFNRERQLIERRNALIQEKKYRTHRETYDLLKQDIQHILNRFRVTQSDLATSTKIKEVAEAREAIAVVALERLRPLGLSEVNIAAHIKMKRTTLLAAAERWNRRFG
jgi:acetolactate synthase small subunit